MLKPKYAFFLLFALTVLSLQTAYSSVAVYPQTLFINYPNRSVAITVSNPTDSRQELWVDFRYGYPLVDDSGKFYVKYLENPPAQEPNAVPWLRAYPQRFVLEGRESQVIRIMVQPPVGLTAGEYWARVVISSQQRTARPPQAPGGDVRMRMEFISQVDVPLQVRTGAVSSGVKVHNITSVVDNGELKMGIDISRLGNASYWGTMKLFLREDNGRVVATQDRHIAIYRDLVYPMTMDVSNVPPGSYVLEVNIDNKRPGVPAQFRTKADAVRFTYQLTIP
jgi:hypothetical protein